MDLSKIIAISGYPGLFKVVAQANNGIIVESLVDKKRMPAYSHYKISGLDDISLFTYGEDVPLKNVLGKIYELEQGKSCIDSKSQPEELKAYLEKVLPDYDKDRVHLSDIKKLFSWYNLLLANNLLSATSEDTSDQESSAKPEEVSKTEKQRKTTRATAKPKSESGQVKATAAKAPRKSNTPRKTGG